VTRLRIAAVAAAFACALVTIGANGATSGRTHRLKVPPAPALPRALSVDETEYELNPSRTVVSSGTVRLSAYNRGMDDHDLVVYDAAGTALGRAALPPGESGELTVTLPAGSYRVVCSLFAGTPISHEALGMRFMLTVQDPPTAPAALLQAQRR
jgi:plastocyanin